MPDIQKIANRYLNDKGSKLLGESSYLLNSILNYIVATEAPPTPAVTTLLQLSHLSNRTPVKLFSTPIG